MTAACRWLPRRSDTKGEVFTFQGKKRVVTPRALETGELPGVVEQFRRAAENAREAGFDGVELHGSNGYLLDQFLRDGSNQRTDAYGGSIENRARFPLEVARAVVGVWGAERVGYRLAPQSFPYAGVTDSTPAETFTHMARELSRLGLGYLHVTEAVSGQGVPSPEQRISPLLRKAFQGAFIVNGGYDAPTGEAAIALGEADLVAYGVPFLANPDLPERFRHEASLNPVDASTFFTGEEKGYTDYPTLR